MDHNKRGRGTEDIGGPYLGSQQVQKMQENEIQGNYGRGWGTEHRVRSGVGGVMISLAVYFQATC